MNPVERVAGTSVGYRSEDHPLVFTCTDFAITCCSHCHANNHIIVLYPWSVFSRSLNRMPDLGLGIRAEICCALFHHVRDLPREWWILHYAKKQGWSKEDGEKLSKAVPENYFRIWNEIASRHFKAFGGGIKAQRGSLGTGPKSNPRSKEKGCPSCGGSWDGIACDNCGHSD